MYADFVSDVLTQYGVQPRYPHEMEILENDMRKALDYVRQIRDFELLSAAEKELEQEA